MKLLQCLCLFFILLGNLTGTVAAWDLELGVRALIPRIGTDDQEYEDESGRKVKIKPDVESTATGRSYHLGLRIDSFQIDYDSSEFHYDSTIEANGVVTVDTDIESKITENRLGVNYHLERELAGIFAGIGVSDVKEELTSDDNTWTYKTTTPYFKMGFDLIINALTLRYEQVFLNVGAHGVQVNSFGILLVF